MIELTVNGRPLHVRPGTTVAAAVTLAGETSFRHSVTGEPRGPLCGMGICFECRVTVGGKEHVRGCQLLCRDGMEVRTT
jgi:D-hydroxyproline dehydrogenase subunit gamma